MHRLVHHSLSPTQNFLRRAALVDHLLQRSSIQPGDLVLDLGAGTGLIARRLVAHGCQVVAVEKDTALADRLRLEFAGVAGVQVRQADVLRTPLPCGAYKVFANIPFNATAAIIQRLAGADAPPRDAYLVVQREAFERFSGRPRTTLAAVLLFPWFETSLVWEFRRTDFAPAPRVDVVMLRLHKRGPPLVSAADAQLFRDFVVRLFTAGGGSVGAGLAELLGRRRGRRLARALGVLQAPPSHVPCATWLALFSAAVQLVGEELRWQVAHAERHLRTQQRRLQKVHRRRPVKPGAGRWPRAPSAAGRAARYRALRTADAATICARARAQRGAVRRGGAHLAAPCSGAELRGGAAGPRLGRAGLR